MMPSSVRSEGLLSVRILSTDSFIEATTAAGINQVVFAADDDAILITLSIAAALSVI